jgi:hypothetical protein
MIWRSTGVSEEGVSECWQGQALIRFALSEREVERLACVPFAGIGRREAWSVSAWHSKVYLDGLIELVSRIDRLPHLRTIDEVDEGDCSRSWC